MPAIAEALTALGITSVTIDGEGEACGQNGSSDFDLLRAAAEGSFGQIRVRQGGSITSWQGRVLRSSAARRCSGWCKQPTPARWLRFGLSGDEPA